MWYTIECHHHFPKEPTAQPLNYAATCFDFLRPFRFLGLDEFTEFIQSKMRLWHTSQSHQMTYIQVSRHSMYHCWFHFMAQRCNLSTNHFRFNRSNKIKYRRNEKFLRFFPRFYCNRLGLGKSPWRLFPSQLISKKCVAAWCSCDYIRNVLDLWMESQIIIMSKQR